MRVYEDSTRSLSVEEILARRKLKLEKLEGNSDVSNSRP